jgi:hypothetical protein
MPPYGAEAVTKAADYLLAAVLVFAVLVMQSCTDDNGPDMPIGAACKHRTDAFVKCGRSQFRPI